MQDIFVDVTAEFPAMELMAERDPTAFVIRRLRDAADRKCDENGARLRTDRTPEVIVTNAQERATGAPMVLVATRWAVVAPTSVHT